MSLFMKGKKEPLTIIVGCGRLGAGLANTLSDQGENVVVLDENEEAFRKLSAAYGGLTQVGDATDLSSLKKAGIEEAQVVVSVTNNDNINIMVAQIAREKYHIPRVVCRIYDPERECVYRDFGIETVCPSILSAQAIEKVIGQQEEG